MSIAQRIERIIATHGEAVTYRKISSQTRSADLTSRANTYTEYSVYVHFRLFSDKELAGLVQQGTREVRLASEDLEFVPAPNDVIVTAEGVEYVVIKVDGRKDRNHKIIYILSVKG